ncbi:MULTISPECIES: helix-turn-helix domain-containing protein [unclassified Bilifractor]|uniref:helix-turn-helix domain-containing protein n=1 Tax=unclassified Bilifractor TaxID=2815795 RepID=UPI003F930521
MGTGLRVYFPALKSALIDQPKAQKHQNTEKNGALDDAMVLRIIEILKEQPDISQEALGENLGVTRRIVQKYINALKEAGRIERVGGKRYGHWEINE